MHIHICHVLRNKDRHRHTSQLGSHTLHKLQILLQFRLNPCYYLARNLINGLRSFAPSDKNEKGKSFAYTKIA